MDQAEVTAEGLALLELLEEERLAACAADVERLVALQEPKSEAIRRCAEALPSDKELVLLGDRAQNNIALIRHLTNVLHGLLVRQNEDTYGAGGERVASDVSILRGRA